jgi:hypothetical protein
MWTPGLPKKKDGALSISGGVIRRVLRGPAHTEENRHEVILPQLKETFVAFDARFATMTWATCHGEGVTDGSYKMPSASVPKLPGSEEAFYEYIKDPEHARWSQFMMDKVWPQMATLLKVPMFDPSTHADGFSCNNCHTLEGVGH